MSFLDIKDLNNTWVIVKRHNGNVFFKRRGYITCLKNCPDTDCLYYNEEEVKAEVERLNSTRKRCKYGIENASKYFVNSYSSDTWNRNCIYNGAVPIKEAQKYPHKVHSFESALKRLNEVLVERSEKDKSKLDMLKLSRQNKIDEFVSKLDTEIKEQFSSALKSAGAVTQFNNFDFNQIKNFETQGDKIFKVLFQKTIEEKKIEEKKDVSF